MGSDIGHQRTREGNAHMRVIRTAGACALALAAIGIGAGSASAYEVTGLPEIGRCVKAATPKTGQFNYKNCVRVSKGGNTGEYNWEPGPGEKGTFQAVIGFQLNTVGGNRINCTGAVLTGEFLNGKEVKVTNLTLGGCVNIQQNKGCYTNPLEPGTIESTQELVGEIGFIPHPTRPSVPWVGLDLKGSPEGVPFLQFSCGEELGAESVVLEGSVIGRLTYLNKMLPYNLLKYTEEGGKQIPEAFIGGEKDTLLEKVTVVAEPLKKTEEQVGLKGAGELSPGETIEIKSRQK
jgi:hypothetical protein